MAITDNEINKEMTRIQTLRQEEWNYVRPRLAGYQGINAPTPYVPASDEVRRAEALQNLRTNQAIIAHEVKQENAMWDGRNAAAASRYAAEQAAKQAAKQAGRGGYRKSRRSRTPKRVQKRKQTRRHRHRHRR